MPLVPITIETPSTDGNAFVAPVGSNTPRLYPNFKRDASGKWRGACQVPADYSSGGTVRISIMANATSGVTRMNVNFAFVADAESMDPSLTAGTAQDITVPATALLRKDADFTVTGAAAEDVLLVEVEHAGAHANDTLAAETVLVDAVFEYTAA